MKQQLLITDKRAQRMLDFSEVCAVWNTISGQYNQSKTEQSKEEKKGE